VHTGERKLETARITVIDYDEKNFHEKQMDNIEQAFQYKTTPTVSWINVDGLHDVSIIEKIGSHFDIHSLVLEDILSIGQRPKFEDMEKYIFVVLNMLYFDGHSQKITSEQVSIVLAPNYVISFQENIGDVFDPIRDRLRNAKGRIRKMQSDYLMYSLLDAVVDSYFNILEKLGEKIEILEEQLVTSPTEKTLHQIHYLKREMISLRKSIWPLREVLSTMERAESPLISKATAVYLRDVYDHSIQVIDTTENFREMVSGMLDIYLSSLSNKMNNVMKVLTIIATIFIPLTFVAGVYGMNFDNMPELKWKYGYFAVLIVMAIISLCMLVFFRRKKWI
jgi:magnesium transporter